jgi:hypothetical protein
MEGRKGCIIYNALRCLALYGGAVQRKVLLSEANQGSLCGGFVSAQNLLPHGYAGRWFAMPGEALLGKAIQGYLKGIFHAAAQSGDALRGSVKPGMV